MIKESDGEEKGHSERMNKNYKRISKNRKKDRTMTDRIHQKTLT